MKPAWKWAEIILLFCSFFLPGYLGLGGLQAPGMSGAMLSVVVSGLPQLFLLLYILAIQADIPLGEFGISAFKARDLLHALFIYGGIILLLVPFTLGALFLPGKEKLFQGYRWSLSSAGQLPLALGFCLVSGYKEELFFRSYLLTRLSGLGVPPVFAVAASVALFSLGHLYEGPAALGIAAVQGIYLSVVFIRWKNLHSIAIAHALYNFSVLAVNLLAGVLPAPG